MSSGAMPTVNYAEKMRNKKLPKRLEALNRTKEELKVMLLRPLRGNTILMRI
jgi:hypothetical protein